jgi:probable HAF family extracellular repeat protein
VAFVRSRDNGKQDLNKLIPAGSGWQLTVANAINNRGQITGQGNINGQAHAFLVTEESE